MLMYSLVVTAERADSLRRVNNNNNNNYINI